MRSFESAMLIGERWEPTTILLVSAIASTAIAAGTTAYQLSQAPPKPPDISSFLPEIPKPTAPPPPKALAAPATPAPGTTGASLAAQRQVEDENERNRRRLGRQQTVLTSPVGAQIGGTFLGG